MSALTPPSIGMECKICLNECSLSKIRVANCGHTYCETCVEKIKDLSSCCFCRQKISSMTPLFTEMIILKADTEKPEVQQVAATARTILPPLPSSALAPIVTASVAASSSSSLDEGTAHVLTEREGTLLLSLYVNLGVIGYGRPLHNDLSVQVLGQSLFNPSEMKHEIELFHIIDAVSGNKHGQSYLKIDSWQDFKKETENLLKSHFQQSDFKSRETLRSKIFETLENSPCIDKLSLLDSDAFKNQS